MFDKHIFRIFLIFILSSIIIVLATSRGDHIDNSPLLSDDVHSYNDGWTAIGQEGETVPIILPFKIEIAEGEIYHIKRQLPENFVEDMTLCFWTDFSNLNVYVNEDLIYEYGHDINSLMGDYNGAYHLFNLPSQDTQAEIVLELANSSDRVGQVNDVMIGSKRAIIQHMITIHLPVFIICILILLSGFFFIAISIYSIKKFQEGKSLLYLGCFLILFSLWSITRTNLFRFLIPYQYIEYLITFQSLLLFPIPFILFLKGSSHSSKYKEFNILLILFSINYILNNVFALTGTTHYFDLIYIFIYLVIGTMVIAMITIIRELFLYKNEYTYVLVTSVLIICIATSIDIVRNYYSVNIDNSYYLRIGILFFTIFNGFSTLKKTISMVKMGINSRVIEKLAYTDILTNIKNRTSYVQDIDKLNQSLNENSDIITVMFDLNNLKEANDQHGHDKGDKLLIAAAKCIKESFGDYGECYRIGGDEFAVVIKNVYHSFFQDSMSHLQSMLEEYNFRHYIKLEIPFGYTYYKHDIDRDLYATINRADALMYEAKAMMKAESIKL